MKHPVARAFILSAHNSGRTADDNHGRTQALQRDLEAFKLDWAPVLGCFDGEREASFLIVDRSLPATDTVFYIVRTLAHDYDQRTYLERHTDRTVTLHYTTGASMPLGTFLPDTPKAGEDYTLDPRTGEFWVVR